jgi:hypothetical protein
MDEIVGRLTDLEDRLAEAEKRLTALADEPTPEVRTRRLVVVDDAGGERIILSTSDLAASMQVRTSTPMPTTGVELYACDDTGDATAEVGLLFLKGGNVAAQWRAE